MGGDLVANEKIAGLLYIILGLLLIICPVFSSEFLSICIGFALAGLGIATISKGILFRNEISSAYSFLAIAIGFISLLFGILFIFFINALTFLGSLQFYIVGIIMMVYGLMGVFFLDAKHKIYSIIVLILGILVVIFAAFLASQPLLIAILIGVALIIEGVFLFVMGKSMKLIEQK